MIYSRKRMPRHKENAAPEKKVILSPEIQEDIRKRNPPSARETVARMAAHEAKERTQKEKSIKEALRELKAEDEIQRSADEGNLEQVTADELEKSFGLDKMEEKNAAVQAKRIARTNEILGQARASEIWETVTKEKTLYKSLDPSRATEYVHAVADLVDKGKGLKIRDLNKKFGLPEAYDPIMGSGASRPTAMHSLRGRASAPEMVGMAAAMPSREVVPSRVEGRKKAYVTHEWSGRVPEKEKTTREDLESALIARYGVEPSQVYFKLGEVRPGVASRMQGDPEYQRWVMELRKATGEMMKEEARHREQKEAAAMKEGMARLAKGMKDAETLEEEKFFEAGDRMTREAEEQRRNLLELREELHEDVSELLKQKRTPAVQKQIEMKSAQIARAEARLRGEERGAAMPERASFTERVKGFWKGLFGKKEVAIPMERKEEPAREEPKPEKEPRLGTINELLKTDAGFRDAFQEVLNATPGGEPRAAIAMVHERLDLPFDRAPGAEIRTPKAIEYVEALAGVLASKGKGESKAQGEAVAHLMSLNRELDVTDKDAFWKKFMENHLAGWLWKKREESAPKEEPREVEMPPVIVGDENPPGMPEVRENVEPPHVKERRRERMKPPTDNEIHGRALLEFQRTLDNEHVENRRSQALRYLLEDFKKRSTEKALPDNFSGWSSEHYAKAAKYLQTAIQEWSRPVQPKQQPETRRTGERRMKEGVKPRSIQENIRIAKEIEEEAGKMIGGVRSGKFFEEDVRNIQENIQNYRSAASNPKALSGLGFPGWTGKDFQALADQAEVLLALKIHKESSRKANTSKRGKHAPTAAE